MLAWVLTFVPGRIKFADVTDRDVVTRLQQIAAEPRLFNGHNGHACHSASDVSDELKATLEKVGQLEVAVDHRTDIGQATGIVMERFGLDPDAAFGVLAELSQRTNRKLYFIARQLVTDRDLTGLRQVAETVTHHQKSDTRGR
jgi:ANTAR domain